MADGGKDLPSGISECETASLSSSSRISEQSINTAQLAKADYVDQSIIGSRMNVISGNHNVVNETTNNFYLEASHTNAGEHRDSTLFLSQLIQRAMSLKSQQSTDVDRLIKSVNDSADERSSVSILDEFKLDGLQETDFVVHPQMRKVDVAHYYKGRYERDVAVQNQLVNEVGFNYQDENENKPIQIDEVMASIWQREKLQPSGTVGITAIVASAGSGKTTLTRRLVKKSLGLSSGENIHKLFNEKKMILYVELKDVKDENLIKPSKFLFGGLYETDCEENQAFKWLVENQSDAVIFFDGLDQARFNIYHRDIRTIKNHDIESTWTILYNILARNILRHVKIFITSREFRISELPQKARPHDIIMLHGFTLPDAQGLFTSLLGENGVCLWKRIERMSPRLLHIISQPVFLILTAIVMGKDPRRPPPATITELYDRIIAALEGVENIRKSEDISSVVNKLKEMSFRGMQEGRVVFKISDLQHFELSADDVKDLMAKVPGENLLSRSLMQGDFVFFFCHQSIQEYLAARFVAEMEISRFRDFNKEGLHAERWSVVRRFATGAVYMETSSELVKDREKKRTIIALSILSQLDSAQNDFAQRYIRMELYTSICESNCDDVIKGLSVINASSFPLSRDEAHILGSLTARSDGLDDFNFCNCNMSDELMEIIARSMEGRRVRVDNVDLQQNSLSSVTLRPFLGYHGNDCKMGYFDWKIAQVRVKSHNCSITLKNEINSIITDGNTVAIYNKKLMDLRFNKVHMLDVVVFFGQLFEPALIEINCDEQLYATSDDLRETSEIKLEKMKSILLDCTKEERIDWLSIKASVQQHQLQHLDIAVSGINFTSDEIPDLDIRVNIHRMFRVKDESDFRSILEASQQNKVGLLRCIMEYQASIDDLRSLTMNCKPAVLTLVYEKSEYKHSEEALKTIEVNSSGQNIDINIIEHYKRTFDIWWYLDSGLMNKRSDHHHHHHHHHHHQQQQQHDKHRHNDKVHHPHH